MSSSGEVSSRVILFPRSLVFIKPHNAPGEVWIAELMDALVAVVNEGKAAAGGKGKAPAQGKGRQAAAKQEPSVRMSTERLNVRYFNPEPESTADGGVRFTFAYGYMLASYEAIWGRVHGCRSRMWSDGNNSDLLGFTLETEEYERW